MKKIIECINSLTFKLIFFSAILIFLFHENIIRFIDSVFVIPIVEEAGKTIKEFPITSLVFTILTTLFFLYKIISNRKLTDKEIHNQKTKTKHIIIIVINSIIIIGYPIFRFFDLAWNFTPIHCCSLDYLKYLDFIFIITLSYFIVSFSKIKQFNKEEKKRKKNKEKHVSKQTGFKVDSEINNAEDDILGRKDFAKQIVSLVENKEENKNSLAIGICGDWGSGKTSFLNLLKTYFEKGNAPIIIKLNPWLNDNESAVTKELLNSLANELNKYDKSVIPLISKYISVLTSVNNNPLSSVLKPVEAFYKIPKTAQEQYEALKKKIENINCEIIVFIDDLDRLYPPEIYQTIKLIRNSVNFKNITYIAAYERNYLLKAFEELKIHNHHLFLEKIFQVEFDLPECENFKLRDKLSKKLLSIIDNEEERYYIETELHENYHIPQTIKTVRDINRFFNFFSTSYNILKGEVDISDLFYLETIHFKHPNIYKIIYTNKDDFFEKDAEGLLHLKLNNDKTCISEYLEDKNNKFDLTDLQILELERILKQFLFNEHGYKNKYNNINIDIRFEIYFHYNVLSNNISIVEIIKAREKDERERTTSNLRKFVEKLNIFTCCIH